MSLNDTIRKMSSSNKGQMSFDQYLHIANIILSNNPCNVLIFGMGRDSDLWHSICKGKALFLENVKPFMESVKQASEYSLETLHKEYGLKTMVEVGTAQGLTADKLYKFIIQGFEDPFVE